MKARIFLLFPFIFFALFITFTLFLKSPPVWPDEPIYADIALNLLRKSSLSTSLFLDTLPGSERCACWYPPLFHIMLAGWFKVWGFSIISQRMLSIFFGLCFIYLWFQLAKKYISHRHTRFSGWIDSVFLILLITDINLLIATRLSRPEIMVAVFISLTLTLYAASLQLHTVNKNLLLFLSGVSASIAVLTHFITAFVFGSLLIHKIITNDKKIFRSWEIVYLVIGFIIPLGIYLAFTYQTLDITIEQIRLHGVLKKSYSFGVPLTFTYILYGITTLVYLGYIAKNFTQFRIKKSLAILVGIFLLISWIVAIWAKMHWYFVYPISFLYLGVYIMLDDMVKNNTLTLATVRLKHCVFVSFIILFIFFNVYDHLKLIKEDAMPMNKYSYQKLIDSLAQVPAGTSVFVSSIPDASYAFIGRNTVYKYIDIPVEPQRFFALLDKSDYVVTNQNFRTDKRGLLVTQYIYLNTESRDEVKESHQYPMSIIKLVPRTKRIHPL